jgi:hypothetical protein
MNSDSETIELLDELKKLSHFSSELLTRENIRPETLHIRKSYVYSQFIFSLSLLDGIITLAGKGQARSMVPLVRSLWEGWLGVVFVYAGNTHVWVYYLQLQEELKNKKRRQKMYIAGEIGDLQRYNDRNLEADKIIKVIKRRYKQLPLVPTVITGDRSLERDIKIRQKCQIVDYYQSMRANYKSGGTTLTHWYDTVYSHFSNTTHVNVTELNALYQYDAHGNLHVDISGGEDRKYLSPLLLVAYLYHYQLMKIFIGNISASGLKIPDDMKAARRRMTSKKVR